MPISFQTSVTAVAQIFAMGAMGYYLVRAGVIKEPGLQLLSHLSVNIFFPLFIFYQIIKNFDAAHIPFWWALPLVNVSLVLTGLLVASLVTFRHSKVVTGTTFRDKFMAVSALHNAGYIPLLLIMSLPLGGWAAKIYPCIILSIIGFDSCLWSIGVWLMTKEKAKKGDRYLFLKRMINPPLVSMASALIIALTLGPGAVPEIILKPIKILGDAAMAMAMIVIGGNLSLATLSKIAWPQVSGVILLKLIVLPLITLLVLSLLKLNPLLSFVAMIQACMPSSITLSIIGRNYETDNQDFVNQSIFGTHLLSMLTIPVFLGLYGKLNG